MQFFSQHGSTGHGVQAADCDGEPVWHEGKQRPAGGGYCRGAAAGQGTCARQALSGADSVGKGAIHVHSFTVGFGSTCHGQVEASLQSLFARVPSMMRPDVYNLVKAHLEGEASAAPRGPKEVPATVVQQQPTWLLWVVLGLTLCNTCVCLLVLRLALAFRAVDACLAGVSS